jgi:hypothetical protein
MARRGRGILLLALALAAVGLVWIGQGLGIIRGSGFMTNDVRWAAVGVVLLAVGAVLAGVVLVKSRDSS